MTTPTFNPLHAIRRFVVLRSAWRRSLAMEPRDSVPSGGSIHDARAPGCPRVTASGGSRPGSRSHGEPCCCHP